MKTIPLAICENPACVRQFQPYRTHDRVTRFCCRACSQAVAASDNYDARHARVYRARGSARNYPCADCGNPARDWSQRHDRDGTDPADYDPRCRQCHVDYDYDPAARTVPDSAGEANGNAKLTWEQVREIRAQPRTVPLRVLAARYHVGVWVISKIRTGATWKEPPTPA